LIFFSVRWSTLRLILFDLFNRRGHVVDGFGDLVELFSGSTSACE